MLSFRFAAIVTLAAIAAISIMISNVTNKILIDNFEATFFSAAFEFNTVRYKNIKYRLKIRR